MGLWLSACQYDKDEKTSTLNFKTPQKTQIELGNQHSVFKVFHGCTFKLYEISDSLFKIKIMAYGKKNLTQLYISSFLLLLKALVCTQSNLKWRGWGIGNKSWTKQS